MLKRDFWRLTVSFWPRAANANLQPIQARGFESGDQYYRPDTFDFEHPPSREDFQSLIQSLPWVINSYCLLVNGKSLLDIIQ
jgi:hypothetical protein